MKKLFLILLSSVIVSNASESLDVINLDINLAEYSKEGFASMPSPQFILDRFLNKNSGLKKMYHRYKDNADKESRSEAQPKLNAIELVSRDETTGGIPDDGRAVIQHVRMMALYVTFWQSQHHGAGTDKGFWVVYEINCISEDKERTVNVDAKVTLRGYSDALDLTKVPSYDQVIKSCDENLEIYLNRRKIDK